MRVHAFVISAIAAATLSLSEDGRAGTAHSAAAFRPATPTDAQNVSNQGSYVTNASRQDVARVAADLGSVFATPQLSQVSATVYGQVQVSSGYTSATACWMTLAAAYPTLNTLTSGKRLFARNYLFPASDGYAPGAFAIPLTVTGLQPGMMYTVHVTCYLGVYLSGLSGEQLWAVSSTVHTP